MAIGIISYGLRRRAGACRDGEGGGVGVGEEVRLWVAAKTFVAEPTNLPLLPSHQHLLLLLPQRNNPFLRRHTA